MLVRLSQSGVAGIVDKCEGIEEFRAAAIEVARHGRPYYSEKIRERLQLYPDTTAEQGDKQMLTKKELEVVRHFALGASLTEIARRVNRSISTVATQKSAAMLHLRTNAELVLYAQENGLV